MIGDLLPEGQPLLSSAKQRYRTTIEDVFSFKMNQFVMINEREGHHWSKEYLSLSLNEWRVLALTEAHEPARARDIAEQLIMDKSQLSRLVKALVGKHLLKSEPDKIDARASVLGLTPKGLVLHNNMMDEVKSRDDRILEVLSPEETVQFNDMLNRITAHSYVLLRTPIAPRSVDTVPTQRS